MHRYSSRTAPLSGTFKFRNETSVALLEEVREILRIFNAREINKTGGQKLD